MRVENIHNNPGIATTIITFILPCVFKDSWGTEASDTEAASVKAAWQGPLYMKTLDNRLGVGFSLLCIKLRSETTGLV